MRRKMVVFPTPVFPQSTTLYVLTILGPALSSTVLTYGLTHKLTTAISMTNLIPVQHFTGTVVSGRVILISENNNKHQFSLGLE